MTSFSTLNDILLQHFGLEVPIYSGGGRSLDDPYLLEPDESSQSKDYSSVEYLVVNCLCKLQHYEWKLIRQSLVNQNGRKIDVMEIEVRYVDEEQGSYKKKSQAYYFDITECLEEHKTSTTPHEKQPLGIEQHPTNNHMARTQQRKDSKQERFKTKLIKISLVTILLMGIFPPWTYVFKAGTIYTEKPASYSFILTPPAPEKDSDPYGVKLDLSRLMLQWFMIIVASGSIFYLKSQENEEFS